MVWDRDEESDFPVQMVWDRNANLLVEWEKVQERKGECRYFSVFFPMAVRVTSPKYRSCLIWVSAKADTQRGLIFNLYPTNSITLIIMKLHLISR
jgi:hypothetical protein